MFGEGNMPVNNNFGQRKPLNKRKSVPVDVLQQQMAKKL
jgi:hypothetical protein